MSEPQQISGAVGRTAALRAMLAILVFVVIGLIIWLNEPADLYLWIKAFHVVAIIAWMAGLVYLPRLFVYHTDAEMGSVQSDTFKVMERRLLKVIMTPAMIISWCLGLWLAWSGGHFAETWFFIKFCGVVGLTIVHGFFAKSAKLFARDANVRSARQWRLLNEFPTLLMILIVIMVIVKPFG